MVAIEYERCVRFEDGLRDILRVLIAPQRERDFAALVDKAKITEEVKHTERQNCDRERGRNKSDLEPSSSVLRPKKKARVDRPMRVGAPIVGTEQLLCTSCSRRHHRKCWKRTRECLRCDSLENHIIECPRRSDQMQAMDIGSTHSYIACTVSENLGILVESNTSEVTILSSLEQSIRVNKLFRDVPLEVQGVIFLAGPMELPFEEFDLILGMDWLVKHRVSLDCVSKRVVLRTAEDSMVVVIRERQNYLLNVISVLRAEKLVHKGCEAYLAYISVPDSRATSVKHIRIVKEFPNVFPE
ncbi:uncharacterized protein LOC105797556 [Gossypium raimondii]|uniref:uncharacterized protein LOC105797556 n=1 Tax=Gossypium raimondii TaxID=29730 RepID=UPI00063B0769|nr:uncharacterized protein LOC105797556 [Gossypium raimondii]